jgi:putative sterol carrier protein
VVQQFFDGLARGGFQPALRHVSGTVRCDLACDGQTDHWLVRIDRGSVSVSREDVSADCVIRTDEETFGRLVTGEVNALVALLRGMAVVEGSEELILALQRMLPSPPSSMDCARGGR